MTEFVADLKAILEGLSLKKFNYYCICKEVDSVQAQQATKSKLNRDA